MEGDWQEWSRHVLAELKRLSDGQDKISETLARNTEGLQDHMRRTEVAEARIEMLQEEAKAGKESVEKRDDKIDSRLLEVEDHVKFVNRLMRLFVMALGVPAAIHYIFVLIKDFKG